MNKKNVPVFKNKEKEEGTHEVGFFSVFQSLHELLKHTFL